MIVRGTTGSWRALAAGALAVLALSAAHAQAPAPTEVTTPAGDRILLYPDGRWEYADPTKRAAQPQPATPAGATAAPATPAAAIPVSAGACPPDSQGHSDRPLRARRRDWPGTGAGPLARGSSASSSACWFRGQLFRSLINY
jgi:hypothetical protein